jgi:rare lipoprotein A
MKVDPLRASCYKTASPTKEVRMDLRISKGRHAFPIVVALLLALLIQTLPLQADVTASDNLTDAQVTAKHEEQDGVEGIASYYAKRYHGRRTTSGYRYNPDKLTAAHEDLPFGTKVKVVNLANGREVVVTVNDRCRRKKEPFIDVSRAAAKKLGFWGKGVAKVRIVALRDISS